MQQTLKSSQWRLRFAMIILGVLVIGIVVGLDRSGRVRFTHEGYNPAEANFRRDLVHFIKSLD